MAYYKSSIIVFSVLLALGCSSEQPKEAAQPDTYCLEESFKKSLDFFVATRQQITERVHLTGTVEANRDNVVVFKSLFSGIVANTYFSLGQHVKKGQILADISSVEYGSLNAELQSLESQIKVAQTRLHAVKIMFTDGLASEKELNEAQSELDILHAQKSKVSGTRNLYSASNTKDVFQIKAPASGIVTLKNIAPGMQITADDDDALFTISNLDNIWVMANVYASNLQTITEGMDVEIRTTSYPDEIFTGKISVLSQTLDESAKVLKARIVLKNTDLKFKPGMLTDITAIKRHNEEAVSIPASELIFSDNENYVVVYHDDCNMEVRKVDVMASNNETLFIREGLKENEKVISKNQLLIFNRINH